MSGRTPKGKLYVVATPIGNLKDITLRALEVLKSVDYIFCEDTRTTRKLLNFYDVKGKALVSLFEHNEEKRVEEVVRLLEEGKDVALVSEAGTPAISDPGAKLVREVRARGFQVVPVPGASALCAALSVSGLDLSKGFVFLGFLPKDPNKKRALFLSVRFSPRPLVFFESPHRLRSTLKVAFEVLGERKVVLLRELTKVYEEVREAVLSEVLELDPVGEYVVVVEGSEEEEVEVDYRELLKDLLSQGYSLKEASRLLSVQFGVSKKYLYSLGLNLSKSASTRDRSCG